MRELVLVMDKEVGPTSFDIVRKVRRLFPRGTKVGHGGSLDPFASGVLILLAGRATKLSGALLNADKVYQAKIRLGVATDSMDRTGKEVDRRSVPELTSQMVQAVFSGLEGDWDQIPPMYSAKKQNGVRLYSLARQNVEVERDAVRVRLHRLTLLKLEPTSIEMEVHCSKGTYVRSLAEEIGRRLGTVAHLEELRRLECGIYRLNESCTVEALEAEPERWMRSGFDNYVRLVRRETMVRRPVSNPETLPKNYKDGNSLHN